MIILAIAGGLVAGCGDGGGPGLPSRTFLRAKGLDIVFTVDATDGLNRAAEAPELVAAGRSITDTMVQRLYREWVYAVALKIQPRYLGLAAETNLIRALAPDSVYQAIVTMTNAVAAQINAASLPSQLFVSVQVETGAAFPPDRTSESRRT